MAIQFLRGNKSTLDASQQIFLPGQPIYEQDSGQLKIGNGSDIYSALKYVGASSSAAFSDPITVENSVSGNNTWRYLDVGSTRLVIGSYNCINVTGFNLYSERGDYQLYFQNSSSFAPTWNVTSFKSNVEVISVSARSNYSQVCLFIAGIDNQNSSDFNVRLGCALDESRGSSITYVKNVVYEYTVLTYD